MNNSMKKRLDKLAVQLPPDTINGLDELVNVRIYDDAGSPRTVQMTRREIEKQKKIDFELWRQNKGGGIWFDVSEDDAEIKEADE